MSYHSVSVATTINLLNTRYFLPAIQREFVWKPEQVVKLFDSFLCGYPTGTLLFWELKDENRDKYQVYKFVDEFKQGGTHNKTAVTDGIHQLTLVIDGQQRLTSLLIALRGKYVVKKKYKKVTSFDAWSPQRLYIDLLKVPDEDGEQSEAELKYGLEFFEKEPKINDEECWFRVSKIMDFDSDRAFDDFQDDFLDALPDEYKKSQRKDVEKNLKRLYQVVWKQETVSFYTEYQQDYDRVLNIFIRANDGGTKLSKSDLLMSIITAQWRGLSAREEIYGFVDHLNSNLMRPNAFDKDFIMKTCLVVCDLPVTYKVSNFTNQNIDTIYSRWQDLKSAIIKAVELANTFGIDAQNLTSANALIPIVYFFFHNPAQTLRTNSAYDTRNAALVRRWLIGVLLNRVFGSLGDNVLKASRKVLEKYQHTEADFPAAEINEELSIAGKSPNFDRFAIERFLDVEYGSKECFLALSLLYPEKAWGTMQYHIDHIIPRSLFNPKSLSACGMDYMQQYRYRELCNRIGNLQLLPALENQGKSDTNFSDWLKKCGDGYRTKHLIPEEDSLFDLQCFEEFIEARETLIKQRLHHIFASEYGLSN